MNITEDNYQQADAAIRDILYMFFDLARSYRGFGHNIQSGSFDPFDFLDSEVIEPPGSSFGIDKALLHGGAAIALLCMLSDAWDEDQLHKDEWASLSLAREALALGRMNHLPEIRLAFELGFGADEGVFRQQLQVVYQKYVAEFRWEA